MRRPRLVYAATHPVTADLLLRGQLAFMREHGFDVTVVASPGPALDRVRERERVEVVALPMARAPHPRGDAVALVRMTRTLLRLAPDIVNAGTPKAGLLGMLAARAAGVPVRIYLLRGLRLETATGGLRRVLAASERLASACAHHVACVSESLRRAYVEGTYAPPGKTLVVGGGSSNGVDADRFRRTTELRDEGARRLADLGVAHDAPLVGFVGRLVADKGIGELLDAFERVASEIPRCRLALVGGDLGDESIDPALAERVRRTPGVVATPSTADLAPFYARMDVLAFPSHREGFPNVPLEAACAELPAVGFRSTGVVDAIRDGETGALVERGDAAGLARALVAYLRDRELAARHGRAARERAERLYARPAVWDAWLSFYGARLAAAGLPQPT